MSVEILSIDLNDATIAKLADAIVARMGGNQAVTQSNYPSPETHRTQSAGPSQQGPDPWSGQQAPPQQQQAPQPQQQGGNPMCAHGAMRFVPAGFSNSTGRAYQAFWGCPAPRGQQQCKSVKANQ